MLKCRLCSERVQPGDMREHGLEHQPNTTHIPIHLLENMLFEPVDEDESYIFVKSGSEVRILDDTTLLLGGRRIKAHTVERTDTQKRMVVPHDALITKDEWANMVEWEAGA